MLTFDFSPKIRSETEKTWIWNAPVFGKTVFGVSDLVAGLSLHVNIRFHSIFNKKQNDGSVIEIIHS